MTGAPRVSDRALFDDAALLDFEDPSRSARRPGAPRSVRNLQRIAVAIWLAGVVAAASRLGT